MLRESRFHGKNITAVKFLKNSEKNNKTIFFVSIFNTFAYKQCIFAISCFAKFYLKFKKLKIDFKAVNVFKYLIIKRLSGWFNENRNLSKYFLQKIFNKVCRICAAASISIPT